MGKRLNLNVVVFFSLSLVAFASSIAGAESGTRISEAFDQPQGAVPDDWIVATSGPSAVVEITPSPFPTHAERNGLSIERSGGASHNGAAYYVGSRGSVDEGRMANFTATVIVALRGTGGSSSSGFVLRAQNTDYANFEGYFVSVGGSGENQGISIFWNPDTHVHYADRALAFAHADLTSGADYLLQISAQGQEIEASLWTVDLVGGTENEIAVVKLDDAEHVSAGRIGLRGAYGNSGPIGAWFRDLHINVDQ